jgi:hypothetical protein
VSISKENETKHKQNTKAIYAYSINTKVKNNNDNNSTRFYYIVIIIQLALVVCGRVCAALRLCSADVTLDQCCELLVRRLRRPQERMFAYCAQSRCMQNKNFLGAAGLNSSAFI